MNFVFVRATDLSKTNHQKNTGNTDFVRLTCTRAILVEVGFPQVWAFRCARLTAALSVKHPLVHSAAKVRSPPNRDVEALSTAGPKPTFD